MPNGFLFTRSRALLIGGKRMRLSGVEVFVAVAIEVNVGVREG